MHLDGTGFRPINDVFSLLKGWSPDGRSIYFIKSEEGVGNIWRQPIAGGASLRVTNFSSGTIRALAVSRDERLAFHHSVTTSDAVLIRSLR